MKNSFKKTEGVRLRPAAARGHADHGWLKSDHTFSFADYYDPSQMGFRTLRVINEDRVAPGQGFGMHPHRDMEILTYVVEGALAHKDSMGHQSTIKPGDVQKITAGQGIEHSEFNASKKEPVHLLQIWIVPSKKGLPPSYQEFSLATPDAKHSLFLVGSPQGDKNILQFNQDVYVYRGVLKKNAQCSHVLQAGRGVWVQLVKGSCALNGHPLSAGDGAALENQPDLMFKAATDCEFLLFDMV
ncbi:MAG: quercetin 2,3-dioxygenase [Omnitrophica WOR_2 bacterium RIFCSPHIGHO2_01_FULL_48_9]|nr:MAG: quercetin 2,3-dioxygenase [Omnitrophica WOR_2 bacterium RIFCSPHIGHO2_02_FULL_48_11]OGX30398.1 MAG: quercetin 2,3-dioxygenase [Omnitrophica WOR_2 bacterium RIFCSPHIGHO2_01_FULL_48_9]